MARAGRRVTNLAFRFAATGQGPCGFAFPWVHVTPNSGQSTLRKSWPEARRKRHPSDPTHTSHWGKKALNLRDRVRLTHQESAVKAVARLSAICQRACGADGAIDMAQAKAQLHMTMPEVADSPEFLGLLRFVVNLGALQGGFIAYVKT